MKKNLILIGMVLCTLALLLAACTNETDGDDPAPNENGQETPGDAADEGEPNVGGEIDVALNAAPQTLDLMYLSGGTENAMMLHVFERLIVFDESTEIIPQLASSWDVNEDYTEYTFHLREGVLFHNGNEMTAEDVKASFERLLRVQVIAKDTLFPDLSHFEAVDPYTFKVVFNESSPIFLDTLASNINVLVMPKEFEDVEGGALAEGQVIGTGPYEFEEYVPDQHLVLKKFDEYASDSSFSGPTGYGGERTAYLDRIRFLFVPERSSRLNGLLTGEYDYAQELGSTAYDRLESDPNVVADIKSPMWMPYAFLELEEGPLKNVALRRAVLKTLDTKAIMLAASGHEDLYHLNHSLFYPDQIWYSDVGKDQYNQQDIEGAKALIEESGYNGEEIVLLTNRDYEFAYQAAVVVEAQLQEIGLNAKLDVREFGAAIDALVNSPDQWDMCFLGQGGHIYEPRQNFYNILKSLSAYDSEEFNQLLADWGQTPDIEDRKVLNDRIIELLYQDVPIVIFGQFDGVNGSSSQLHGLRNWPQFQFWDIWLEQ